MSRNQNAGRSHNIKIDNISFERVDELKYLGTNLTNQTPLQEGIKRRLESANACCPSGRIFILPVCHTKFKD
jgi:hypothetical protein